MDWFAQAVPEGCRPAALVLGGVPGIVPTPGVASVTEHSARMRLWRLQAIAMAAANADFAAQLSVPFERRTDGAFDALVTSLAGALQIGRFLRLQMRSLGAEVRVVIAAVAVHEGLEDSLARLMGAGFVEARHKLTQRRGGAWYRFSMPRLQHVEVLLDAVGHTLGGIENGWTEAQFGYVLEVLLAAHRPRAEAANALGVSQGSLFKGLRAARYAAYVEQFNAAAAAFAMQDRMRARQQVLRTRARARSVGPERGSQ